MTGPEHYKEAERPDGSEELAFILSLVQHMGNESVARHDAPNWQPFAEGLLEAPAFQGWLQERAAQAIGEVADAWQMNGWANVLLPRPTPPAIPVVADAQAVTDWLRARATPPAEPLDTQGRPETPEGP